MAHSYIDCAFSGIYRNLLDVLREAISSHQVLSLYQGLGTKNLQSFIAQFVYFYGYSYFKRLYLVRSGTKRIGTTANLVLAAAAGACTAIVTQVSPLLRHIFLILVENHPLVHNFEFKTNRHQNYHHMTYNHDHSIRTWNQNQLYVEIWFIFSQDVPFGCDKVGGNKVW